MHDLGSADQTGRSPVAQVLTCGGVLLLLIGGLLAYPYVSSRLATFPSKLIPTSTLARSTAPPPTATTVVPTSIPTPVPTLTHTPTSTPIPTPTSTPALPSRIVIPTIGVDALIVPISWQAVEVGDQTQAAWEVPDMYAAGWHETSAPLGVPGNTVLNGHNTTHGEIFRDLYTLEVGDAIIVYSGDTLYAYAVTEILILPEGGQPMEVRIENARYILPTDDERLTLVTCHPYGSLRYRLIVIAHPTE